MQTNNNTMQTSFRSRSLLRIPVVGLLLLMTSVLPACAQVQQPSPTPRPGLVINDETRLLDSNGGSIQKPDGATNLKNMMLKSVVMQRETFYRVVVPPGYNTDTDTRYPVIFLLHGLTGNFRDWTERSDLLKLSEGYPFIIVTPEGNNGWYSDSPLRPNDKYESYIMTELVPAVDREFRTIADREHRAIAGLSMGGYGSIKFGIRYRQTFSLVGSFSGAIGIPFWSERTGPNTLIGKSIDVVFGPIGSDARKDNDVFALINALAPGEIDELPYMYLSCGTEDLMMLKPNSQFVAILKQKKIPNEYYTRRGGHTWTFWNGEIGRFLALAKSRLVAQDEVKQPE